MKMEKNKGWKNISSEIELAETMKFLNLEMEMFQ